MNKIAFKATKLSKLVAITAIALSLAPTSAIARSDIDPSNVRGSITYYTNRTDLVDNGTFKRYEEEFKRIYPYVDEVRVIAFADYQKGILPLMQAHNCGDVIQTLPSVTADQYKEYYEPLNDLYNENDIYFYNAWSKDHKIYAISIGNSVEGIVYNKDVFEKAEVTTPLKTIDELYAACEKIKAIGKIPFYVNFGAQWPLQQFDKLPMIIAGDDRVYEKMLYQDHPFSDHKSAYYQSLKILKNLIDKGYTEKELKANTWEESKEAIATGKAAMYYLGNWIIPQIIGKGAPSQNIGFMPMPGDNSGDLKAQMNHDFGYAISKYSKNKETAKAFLKYLLDESDYYLVSGFIPTVKNRIPQLPQLHEFIDYAPKIIQSSGQSENFINVANKSNIDFYCGGYIQDVLTSPDFEKALQRLDERWHQAKDQVLK